MKKLAGILILLFLLNVGLYSQPRFDVDEQVKTLKTELDLSDEQCDSVKIVVQETRDKMMEMRENAGDDWQAMRGQMREIFETSQTRIKQYLTDEQKDKYDKYIKKRQENMRGRFRGRN